MHRRLLPPMFLVAALQAGCDYEAPLNTHYDNPPPNTISGTLVYAGNEAPSHVIVMLFDATNPPPPAGTGRPVTFATVPAEAFTDDGATGLLSAPFAVPNVRATTPENGLGNGYLITAVMDQDHNFVPLPSVAALGGSTYGDWLGTYVTDLITLDTAPLFVKGGQHLDNVTVLIGARQSTQRPAFSTVGDVTLSLARGTESIDPAKVQTYRLQATGIHTSYGPELPLDLHGPCPLPAGATCDASKPACHCDPAGTLPSETAFWVWFVDEQCELTDGDGNVVGYEYCPGGDGKHDPYPAELQAANGIKDTWPRVYIEYMGQPTQTKQGVVFESDLGTFTFEGEDGTNEAPERWVGENFPLALELNFQGAAGLAPPGATFQPFPVQEMSVTWSPVLRHYHADGTFGFDPANGPYDLYDLRCRKDGNGEFPASIPYCAQTGEVLPEHVAAGAWRITVVTHTGQTWILPNEIGLPAAAAAAGLDKLRSTSNTFDVTTQGRWLTLE